MLKIPPSHRIALLIDADNISPDRFNQILKFSKQQGTLQICRAYGDWNQPPLSASHGSVKNLKIEIIQVNRIGKDTTDKGLMMDAVAILERGRADLFIIASGDGDFKMLCERIKEKGRKVIGIGSRANTSPHLKTACDKFHYVDELETLIKEPPKKPPTQRKQTQPKQKFKTLVFRALDGVPHDSEGWVHCGQLGEKLLELDPGFKSRFGSKKLTALLNELSGQIEVKGHFVRVITSEIFAPEVLLQQACKQALNTDGLAHIGQVGEILRKQDAQFESHFGKKKLSKWFKEYPHVFKQQGDYVSLSVK